MPNSVDWTNGIPETGGEFTGAMGQIIGALMETAGIYAQGDILNDFTTKFQNFGAIIFAYALIGGIISFALFGNYKKASFFLLGPALFYWMLETTVPATAAIVRNGNRVLVDGKTEQHSLLQLILSRSGKTITDANGNQTAVPDYGENTKISWFYARFDELTSSVVQAVTGILVDYENRQDLISVARQRAYMQILNVEGHEPGYLQLVSLALAGSCNQKHHVELQLKDKRYSDPEPGTRYERESNYLREKLKTLEGAQVELPSFVIEYLQNHEVPIDPKQEGYSCKEVWDFIGITTNRLAEIHLNEASHTGSAELADSNIPWERVKFEMMQAIVGAKFFKLLEAFGMTEPQAQLDAGFRARLEQEAVNRIGALLLKSALKQTAHGTLTAEVFGRTSFNKRRFVTNYDTIADGYRKGFFTKIVYFAGTIPYIQGVIVYLLTVAFPFFCFFLLIPSRFSGFFIWVSLWIWVKSWDIGFAMKVVLEDILWDYLKRDTHSGC